MKQPTKLCALLLVCALLLTLLPGAVFAAPDTKHEGETYEREVYASQDDDSAFPTGRLTAERVGSRSISDSTKKAYSRTAIPSYYNSNALHYVTGIRNQNPYGTCWAHGAIASCESYMIKHGIRVSDTNAPATTAMNLSEYHLSWYAYSNAYDKLRMLNGDTTVPAGSYLDLGGNGEIATYTLMRWEGLASESTAALAYANTNITGLGSAYAYQNNVAHVSSCTWIPTSQTAAVKAAIMEYGAGTFGYCHDGTYANPNTGAYCFIQTDTSIRSNHDVTVVGWDDSYAVSNFNDASRPANPGAWIIKNSWGAGFGDNGYIYISYEDTASLNDNCYFYTVDAVDTYDNNYQYDGTTNFANYQYQSSGASIAQVFTANGAETLNATALCTWDEGVSYTCKVYTGIRSNSDPTSGTLAATKTGSFTYPGYYTIALDTPVSLAADEAFSVVFTLTTAGSGLAIPVDTNGSAASWVTWTHRIRPNTAYCKSAGASAWTDYSSTGNYRIKAFTKNLAPEVIATTSNAAHGTVTVHGNTILAAPAAGYYAAGYTVLSGSATVVQNGNSFTVTATDSCSVQINFAAKTPCTIRFTGAPDTVNPISTYVGDAVTMPTAAGSFTGYTFLGWVTTAVEGAMRAPTFYAPHSTNYAATGDATLLALFSYSTPGITGYALVTSADSLASGDKLIIACQSQNVVAGYINSSVMTHISAGFTADKTAITGLENEASFSVLTLGGSAGAWTLANESGQLLGATAVKKLSWGSGTTNWKISVTGGNAVIQNATPAYGAILYNTSFPRFTTYVSPDANMLEPQLYRKGTGDITVYTTSTDACLHIWAESERIDATCNDDGTVLYSCTLCASERYEDIPALGHSYVVTATVNPSCTAAGSQSLRCTRCLDEKTEPLPALGHNMVADVVVPPSCTEEGYTEYACTRCDATDMDNITDALGHDFTYTSNSNGTHAVGCTRGDYTATEACNTAGANGACSLCGYREAVNTTITVKLNNTLSLEGATSLNYFVADADLAAYDSCYLSVEHLVYDSEYGYYNIVETRTLQAEDILYNNTYRQFIYTNIPASELNDMLLTTLHAFKDGVEYTTEASAYSAISYCYAIANRETSKPTLRATMANLIQFAAAAQRNFNHDTAHLATANWTSALDAIAITGNPTLGSYTTNTLLAGQTAEIKTLTLDVQGRVGMTFYVLPDAGVAYTDCSLVVTYTDVFGAPQSVTVPGSDWVYYNPTYGYKATMSNLNAPELREIVSAVVKKDGAVISNTYTYSVETYAKTMVDRAAADPSNTTRVNLAALMQAMINYSDAAKNHFAPAN